MKDYENIDNLREQLFGVSSRSQQINILAEYLLDHLNANAPSSGKSTKEIIESYEGLRQKDDMLPIKLYAEHFRVGILVIEVDGQDYIKIKEKKPLKIDFEKLRVIEYCQAPYTQTHIKFRKKFLQSLDILELNKLYKFGEELS
jgi:hypothetical protein